MNDTQSCISNQYTIAIISVLNHKSVSHSINQHKPNHNSHTKNSSSIHPTTSNIIHQDNNVPYQSFSGRSKPIECKSRTFFSLQEPVISSTTSLHDFIYCTCPFLIHLMYVRALAHFILRIPQKLGFLNFRDFCHHDLGLAETLMHP
jgi:hypothetical protein